MENAEKSRPSESGFRLSTKQQAEIGDILLSARSVARQLVSQAKQQSEELLRDSRQQAAQIAAEAQTRAASAVNEADEKSAALIGEAEKKAAAIVREAEGKAEAIVCEAEEKTGPIVSSAEEKAAAIVREAEEHAAVILQEAERNAEAPVTSERMGIPENMQDYVVRCVGDCFTKLRQQQLASIDLINEQWQSFLSNLTLEEAAPTAPPPATSAAPPVRAAAVSLPAFPSGTPAAGTGVPTLSFRSRITLSAVRFPIPGAREMALTSPDAMAKRSSSAEWTDRRASPPLGPIPLTVISWRNRSSSSLDRKP